MMRMHMKRWAWQSEPKAEPAVEPSAEKDGEGDTSFEVKLADPADTSNNALGSFSEEEHENTYWNRPVVYTNDQQSNWRRSSDGSDGLTISDKENQTDHRLRSSPVRLSRPSPLAATNTFWTSSSPRQSFSTVEGIQKLGSTPTGSLTVGLDDNFKRSNSDSSLLCTLEEVTLSSSSEDIPPMLCTNECSKLQQEPASRVVSVSSLEESNVSNKLNWSDPSSSLHSAYQSLSSPSKIEVSEQNKEQKDLKGTVTFTDPFEWAYAVWRRKGLLPDEAQFPSKIKSISRSKQISAVPIVAQDIDYSTSQDTGRNNVDFVSPRSRSTKPWNNDQMKFSNILERWKTQTEKQPLSSPGSCTVLQVNHQNEFSKAKSMRSINGIDSAVRVMDLQTANVETKPKTNVARRNTLHVVEQSGKHPSLSVPILRKASPPRDVAQPTRSSPKSQAWKLKTARDLRLLQEKHLKRDELRRDKTMPSQVRNLLDLKALNDHNYSSNNRSTSQPRNIKRGTSSDNSIPKDDCQITSSSSFANVVELKLYRRAQSQPRSARRNTIALCERTGNDPPVANEPLRVCDLKVDGTQDESFDVPTQISYVPLEDKASHGINLLEENAEFFSPYTQRVMRNLAKVYDVSEDVKTPRGSDSHHPWQHDRLLHRVDSLTESASAELSCKCSCANSVFSGSDDMVEFFLPLMGSACSCGNKPTGLIMPEQPTSLVNILRPWQVSFLGRFGIYFGEELVKSFHRSGAALAKALQQHRKKEGMTPFPLKSCVMALQIWSKTSKTFVRSIREQLSLYGSEGDAASSGKDFTSKLKMPNTLYLLSSFMDKMPSENFLLPSSGNITNNMLRTLDCMTTSPL